MSGVRGRAAAMLVGLTMVIIPAAAAGGLMRTTRASLTSQGREGERRSLDPVISGDGRFVAFRSEARNLVPGEAPTRTMLSFVCRAARSPKSRTPSTWSGSRVFGSSRMKTLRGWTTATRKRWQPSAKLRR